MNPKLQYKVGLLGCPSLLEPWNEEQVSRIQSHGFNMLQLNIAWGCRPGDEPLNLEDVVDISADQDPLLRQSVALASDQTPEAFNRRRNDLRNRIEWTRNAGLRTLFHFGAPYNGGDGYRDLQLQNCLLDGKTPERYVRLLSMFHEQFPGVDDVLIYTYDQDAWLCNEFGVCESCRGIPLHERVVPFIHKLAEAWQACNPNGRLWWEPWELSAGQVLQSINRLNPQTTGVMLHSNIAEVTATLPVDRFLKNACRLAESRGLPVIVEGFLGGPTEELEPMNHLTFPQVTVRQLQSIYSLPGISGIKEYFGLVPSKEDPSLRATAQFFTDPEQTEDQIITSIAELYADCSDSIIRFWSVSSEAMELFPWDISWYVRKLGQCDPKHTMNAAFIRGQQCHTPSWDSTRRAIFMKTDDQQPDAWLLEDIQLRCDLSAVKLLEAIRLGKEIEPSIPEQLKPDFAQNLIDLEAMRARVLSYVYHLRETNVAAIMRKYTSESRPIPGQFLQEMDRLLELDRENQGSHEEIDQAIAHFRADPVQFLADYFQPAEQDLWPRGPHSLTSK
ncbi:hypothetical protein [Paenibacillus mendelii]|uniref:Uncharacterized protein n=1 Tax=Paenibacillus mendelii TaxID=206163 RepID=A0ABV6JJW1_9BACL|nr:hypothetical protein [Paenibacillus mendelii]MCQ6559131.1 hypothetical protein [Paenibacillus mendelii]